MSQKTVPGLPQHHSLLPPPTAPLRPHPLFGSHKMALATALQARERMAQRNDNVFHLLPAVWLANMALIPMSLVGAAPVAVCIKKISWLTSHSTSHPHLSHLCKPQPPLTRLH